MRSDIVELIEYGRGLGLRMTMATCGHNLNDNLMKELKDAGLLAVSVSIDSLIPELHDKFRGVKGAYNMVLETIDICNRCNVKFQVNTTITQNNINEIPEIAKLAQRLGAYCFNPFILVPVGRGKHIQNLVIKPDDYETLLHTLAEMKNNSSIEIRVTCGPQFARVCREDKIEKSDKIRGCLAGSGFAFISHKGNIQTCGFLEISAGNLISNGYDFAQIWEKSELFCNIRNHNNYKGSCNACKYLEVCQGCRARAYSMLGDYMANDPICKLAMKS